MSPRSCKPAPCRLLLARLRAPCQPAESARRDSALDTSLRRISPRAVEGFRQRLRIGPHARQCIFERDRRPLGADLAKRCKELLDGRIRSVFTGRGYWDSLVWLDWEKQKGDLYAAAAEVANALRK